MHARCVHARNHLDAIEREQWPTTNWNRVPNAETTTAPYRADKIDISAWKLSSIGSKELLFASDGARRALSADDETIVRGG